MADLRDRVEVRDSIVRQQELVIRTATGEGDAGSDDAYGDASSPLWDAKTATIGTAGGAGSASPRGVAGGSARGGSPSPSARRQDVELYQLRARVGELTRDLEAAWADAAAAQRDADAQRAALQAECAREAAAAAAALADAVALQDLLRERGGQEQELQVRCEPVLAPCLHAVLRCNRTSHTRS